MINICFLDDTSLLVELTNDRRQALVLNTLHKLENVHVLQIIISHHNMVKPFTRLQKLEGRGC